MTLKEMKEKAEQIQKDCNMILGKIDHEIKGSINWGDLGCVDVSISLFSGDWTVLIEEADPNNRELSLYVQTELARLGHDVSVVCEW